MSSPRTTFILTLAALGMALGLLSGCGDKKAASRAISGGRTVAAELGTAQQAALAEHVVVPGAVASEDQVQVASRLMGFIREIKVQEGETVKPGQLLFVVDPTDIQGQVSQARAGLAQAEAALADAQSDYDRFASLYKEEAIPKAQWDKVQLQYQIARQQAAAARAGLGTASSQLRYSAVAAPIAGVVTQKLANAGDLAAPGRPVLVIEGLSRLQVRTSVSDTVFDHIKAGDKVGILAEGREAPLPGVIAQAVPAADPLSHTHLVKIDLPKASSLRSGSFVQVEFSIGTRQGILVPARAVVDRAGIRGVFVVDEQGIARFRMVRSGTVEAGMADIQAGLKPGERIAVSPPAQLENGDRVSVGAHEE